MNGCKFGELTKDRRFGVWLLLVCTCALLPLITASAQIGSALSDADLIRQSDIIVTGRVTEIAAGFDDRTIYTYVTIDVADVLKGWVPEPQIVIKQPGGRVGDLEQQVPEGQAAFTRGEQVLIFLHARASDFTLSPTALWQGKWTIARDPTWGQTVARRHEDARLLQSFVARVRDAAARVSTGPSGGRINVSPPEARRAVPIAGALTSDGGTVERSMFPVSSHATAAQRPAAPTNLRIVSGATVFVSWTAPTTGEAPTSYIIEAGSAPGLSDRANFSVGPATNWSSDPSAPLALVFYYVRVRAVNRFGAGPASEEVTFFPDNFGRTPPAPTSLRPEVDGTTVVLSWVAPNFSVGGSYIIEVGSAPGLSDLAAIFTLSEATRFTATNVPPRIYFVRVRVFTGATANGIPSNEVMVTVGTPASCFAPPGAPVGLVATASGSTVSLTWGASAGPLESYVVEYGQAVAVWNRLDTASIATSLQASNVPTGAYFVRVRGRNACGLGAPSNEDIVTVF